MKQEWVLDQEAFDTFLAWLDSDRDRAGEKYEAIRRKLIRDFLRRQCLDAETLADQVINRVIGELPEIVRTYSGDPASYIDTVAKTLPVFWRKLPAAKPFDYLCETKSSEHRQPLERLMSIEALKSGELSFNQEERVQ